MRKYLRTLQILSVILIIASITIYTVFARNDIIILIAFFAGVIILFSCLIFSYLQTEKEGQRRASRSKISITLSVILFALSLVLFQTISVRHNIKYDTTGNKRFSLSPQTKKILGDLNENIKITSFLKDTSKEKPADEDLFKEYIYLNNKIEYEFINPDRDP
ncbi:Gldg family protein, partial [bacterium]|nr:Gldg family protein [bacterium]